MKAEETCEAWRDIMQLIEPLRAEYSAEDLVSALQIAVIHFMKDTRKPDDKEEFRRAFMLTLENRRNP